MTGPTEPRAKKPRAVPPGLLRRRAAAAFPGVGASTFDRHDAAGLIPPAVRVGGCKCRGRRELLAWIDAGCPTRAEWVPLWQARLAARHAT